MVGRPAGCRALPGSAVLVSALLIRVTGEPLPALLVVSLSIPLFLPLDVARRRAAFYSWCWAQSARCGLGRRCACLIRGRYCRLRLFLFLVFMLSESLFWEVKARLLEFTVVVVVFW